jgi:hypothetical protein
MPPEVMLRGKPSGRSRWASASKATLTNPRGAYSSSSGLT